jgi:hypothetical protein
MIAATAHKVHRLIAEPLIQHGYMIYEQAHAIWEKYHV